jgi:antitoxin (DNA-binding transcriptional repressor) of toxin-antitoxin stability system
MKAVGIKQLKARLSEYLRLVKSGEVILVTERDEVIAEMRPSRHRGQIVSDLEETLQMLDEQKEIERAVISHDKRSWKCKGLGLPVGTANQWLNTVRDERYKGPGA